MCCVLEFKAHLAANGHGDSVVPSDGLSAAAGDASTAVPPYLVELIRTTVSDELELVEERLHGDLLKMHIDTLVQFDEVKVSVITTVVRHFDASFMFVGVYLYCL